MKGKIKLVLTIQILVLILLASNLQAKNSVNILTDEEPACIGCIHGSVGNSHGIWAWESYPFVLVDAEIKKTRCGPLGLFRLFLPLNCIYNITAYVGGFKPLTKKVNLTKEVPIQEITFDFFESEAANIESKDNKNLFFLD